MWFVKCTILKEFMDKDKNEVSSYVSCGRQGGLAWVG
jgi:hypothetical protein